MSNVYDYFPFWFSKLKDKDIKNCGFVIMPNHMHLLLYVSQSVDLNRVLSEGKRFLAYEIVKRLKNKGKDAVLGVLKEGVSENERKKGKLHQVFRLSFDAKECVGNEEIEKVLDYIHHNPVSGKWSLVDDFIDFPYSSAGFYENEEKHKFNIVDFREITSESLSGDSEG